MDNFWVAAPNVAPEKLAAFRRAMRVLRAKPVLLALPESPAQPRGFVDTSRFDLEALEQARTTAERFHALEPEERAH